MLSDHAEQLGEVEICRNPGAPGHDSWVCRLYRTWPRAAFFVMNAAYSWSDERWGFCGEDGRRCLDAAGAVWRQIQAAAEAAYDRTPACRFTSFVGYEWTAGAGTSGNLHRNVLFRNAQVPALPISVMETGHTAADLWDRLESDCLAGTPGCEVLVIPHNANLDGGGAMFGSAVEIWGEIGAAEAARRARFEPLIEIMQHKGDSECLLAGDTTDEACGFEKFPYDDMSAATEIPFVERTAPQRVQFVREAFKRGLAIERAHGANPFRAGVVASTDTHLGTPGLTAERDFPGHGGAGVPADDVDLPPLPDRPLFNPGGLAVVWAEENTRDALFAGMERRETYGTSGTRPVVRLFAGGELPADLCERDDFAASGYAHGVPMGGVLDGAAAAAPRVAVLALRDPAPEAADLERIELVKGWIDEAGRTHERVMTVAGGDTGATVDLATCGRRGTGHGRLCAVWEDPEPAPEAFYYARVLENPSCRWTQWACLEAGGRLCRPGDRGRGPRGLLRPRSPSHDPRTRVDLAGLGGPVKRPLLRFFVLGLALFVAEGVWRAQAGPPPPAPLPPGVAATDDELWFREALALGAHESDAIVRRRLARNMRFALGEEDARSDAELVEEAIAMGMHETDLVVRRRLVQKMKLAIHELVRRTPPDEDELAAYLEANAERYTEPARVQLTQIYFRDEARASAALAGGLGEPEAVGHVGDALPIPRALPPHSEAELARQLGPDFAKPAFDAPLETWSGPIASAYGFHLVWIHERRPAVRSALEVVRSEVRESLLHERAEAAVAEATRALRARYGLDGANSS